MATKKTAFALAFAEIRHAHGLSQVALAVKAGKSLAYVGNIERGKNPLTQSRPTLDQFCAAMGATVAEVKRLYDLQGWTYTEGMSFADLVDADRRTTLEQKNVLKGIYRTWFGKKGLHAR